MKQFLIIVVVALLASACIVGESTHQIYIDPEGSVTWVVHEREVRSISGPEEYKVEEESFLLDVRLGVHPVAQAFDLLGPDRLDYRLLRTERPFELRTEARFRSIEDLAVNLLDRLDLNGTVSLCTKDEVTRLEIAIEPSCGDDDLPDDGVLALADDLLSYRLVMTEGRFVDAVGFDLLEEGVVAVPVESEVDCEGSPEKPLVLSLSWVS